MRSTRWLAAALVLAGGTALAAPPWPDKAERDAAVAAAFAEADADDNGALTAEEFESFHELMRQRMQGRLFARADANGDGQLTLEELQAARPPRGRRSGGPPPA
jgi:Ca2+-binding EF-hand superfamily protein